MPVWVRALQLPLFPEATSLIPRPADPNGTSGDSIAWKSCPTYSAMPAGPPMGRIGTEGRRLDPHPNPDAALNALCSPRAQQKRRAPIASQIIAARAITGLSRLGGQSTKDSNAALLSRAISGRKARQRTVTETQKGEGRSTQSSVLRLAPPGASHHGMHVPTAAVPIQPIL
jgi:hypothetical protein